MDDDNKGTGGNAPWHWQSKRGSAGSFEPVTFPYGAIMEEEDAETSLLSSLEQRQQGRNEGGWKAAVRGERPPLGDSVPSNNDVFGIKEGDQPIDRFTSPTSRRKSFADAARRVIMQKKSASRRRLLGHRKRQQVLSSLTGDQDSDISSDVFQGVGVETTEIGNSKLAVEDTQTDQLLAGAMAVESLFSKDDDMASTTSSVATNDAEDTDTDTERGTSATETLPLVARRAKKLARRFRKRRACLGIAYYQFGNPHLDFLPGDATVSWWSYFFGRLAVTLDFSTITQWLAVDMATLGSKLTVRFLGPYITLFAIQGKGWPFIAIAWSIWNMIMLYGSDPFSQHWLYFVKFDIFSHLNSGNYILKSDFFLRMLLAMLIAGLATSVKRTYIAMYFGRRSFVEYKPKLEAILGDILLVTEIAELSHEANEIAEKDQGKNTSILEGGLSTRQTLRGPRWPSMDFQSTELWDLNRLDSLHGGTDEGLGSKDEDGPPEKEADPATTTSSRETTTKDLLDDWQEPVDKTNKSQGVSIHDILKFRRALGFMDNRHPFSEAFGPASNRDECISSAQKVYERLLTLSPESNALRYDDIDSFLMVDAEGVRDTAKEKSFKRLFRPDVSNKISRIDFVKSCDSVYKRLRYFRASVGNSSVIDKVLEDIVDTLFALVLTLVTLTVLKFNPWPLLVSISTLLVSFAFALGPSASRYIEGILLIAIRRPYDLGDRIIVVGPQNVKNDGVDYSWFVDDIGLFTTTVRFASTNEVATLSNGSIAASRIVNCQRSPNAIVRLDFKLQLSILDDDKFIVFHNAMKTYVRDHPRRWESIAFFRCEEVNPDFDYVAVALAIRHRSAWQNAVSVLEDRSELEKFCFELSKSMDVDFHTTVPKRVYFTGGGARYKSGFPKGLIEQRRGSVTKQNEASLLDAPTFEAEQPVEEEIRDPTPRHKQAADALFLAQLQSSHG